MWNLLQLKSLNVRSEDLQDCLHACIVHEYKFCVVCTYYVWCLTFPLMVRTRRYPLQFRPRGSLCYTTVASYIPTSFPLLFIYWRHLLPLSLDFDPLAARFLAAWTCTYHWFGTPLFPISRRAPLSLPLSPLFCGYSPLSLSLLSLLLWRNIFGRLNGRGQNGQNGKGRSKAKSSQEMLPIKLTTVRETQEI